MSFLERFKGKCSIVGKNGAIEMETRTPSKSIHSLPKIQSKTPLSVESCDINAFRELPSIEYAFHRKASRNKSQEYDNHTEHITQEHEATAECKPTHNMQKVLCKASQKDEHKRNNTAIILASSPRIKSSLANIKKKMSLYTPISIQEYMQSKPTSYIELGKLGPNIRTQKWYQQCGVRNSTIEKGNRYSMINKSMVSLSHNKRKSLDISTRKKAFAYSRQLLRLSKNGMLPNKKCEAEEQLAKYQQEKCEVNKRIQILLKSIAA